MENLQSRRVLLALIRSVAVLKRPRHCYAEQREKEKAAGHVSRGVSQGTLRAKRLTGR